MRANLQCYYCCIRKIEGLLNQYNVSDTDSIEIIKDVFKIMSECDDNISAPVLMNKTMLVLENKLGVTDTYKDAKEKYNKLLIEREDEFFNIVMNSDNIFESAVKCAITGNYIDFGAMDTVYEGKLNELLEKREEIELSSDELSNLKDDIEKGKNLLYITDNAGEIVLDKVFIRVLKKLYPHLNIKVMVRGVPTLNDATIKDALEIGMNDFAQVISNGTSIPGTQIEVLSDEAKKAVYEADLCIAKGQGNFETLRGSGINVYYMFLCKCDLFVKKFGVERFTPVLANEKRIVQYA